MLLVLFLEFGDVFSCVFDPGEFLEAALERGALRLHSEEPSVLFPPFLFLISGFLELFGVLVLLLCFHVDVVQIVWRSFFGSVMVLVFRIQLTIFW